MTRRDYLLFRAVSRRFTHMEAVIQGVVAVTPGADIVTRDTDIVTWDVVAMTVGEGGDFCLLPPYSLMAVSRHVRDVIGHG